MSMIFATRHLPSLPTANPEWAKRATVFGNIHCIAIARRTEILIERLPGSCPKHDRDVEWTRTGYLLPGARRASRCAPLVRTHIVVLNIFPHLILWKTALLYSIHPLQSLRWLKRRLLRSDIHCQDLSWQGTDDTIEQINLERAKRVSVANATGHASWFVPQCCIRYLTVEPNWSVNVSPVRLQYSTARLSTASHTIAPHRPTVLILKSIQYRVKNINIIRCVSGYAINYRCSNRAVLAAHGAHARSSS